MVLNPEFRVILSSRCLGLAGDCPEPAEGSKDAIKNLLPEKLLPLAVYLRKWENSVSSQPA
jgi:hypothetical protein